MLRTTVNPGGALRVIIPAVALLVVTALLAISQLQSGQAHAGYDYSEPAANSTISTPPTEVVIYFTQEVDPNGILVAVLGPDGSRVDLQDAALDLCDPERKRVTVSLPDGLPNGEYTVQWQTTSLEDDEQDSGSFAFTVDAAGGAPVASPTGSPGASPAASPDASPVAIC